MTSSLPQPLVELLTSPRPDRYTWSAICRLLDNADVGSIDLTVVKRVLASWPKELPRSAPKSWLKSASLTGTSKLLQWHAALLSLCHDTRENEAHYNLYETAIGTSPLLRCRDGSQAVTMWRQPRGEVTLITGQRMVLGGGQSGLADLGGLMVVEWDSKYVPPNQTFQQGLQRMRDVVVSWSGDGPPKHRYPQRIQVYVEIEVKIDGCMPPMASEYRGDSKRQLTTTEQEQVQRQKAQTARGGGYFFAERCDEAVAALVRYRDEVLRRIS